MFCTETKKPKPVIEDKFYHAVEQYEFAGNVRELKNMIESLIITSELRTWDNKSIAMAQNSAKLLPKDYNLSTTLAEQEKDIIRDALIKCNGKQKDATILLNVSENTLCHRIKLYRLK